MNFTQGIRRALTDMWQQRQKVSFMHQLKHRRDQSRVRLLLVLGSLPLGFALFVRKPGRMGDRSRSLTTEIGTMSSVDSSQSMPSRRDVFISPLSPWALAALSLSRQTNPARDGLPFNQRIICIFSTRTQSKRILRSL